MKLEFSRQSFEKCSNIKFHENPCSGSRVVPADRETNVKIIVAFRILRRRLKDLRSAHVPLLCVLCGSQKKNTAVIFTYTSNLLVLIIQSQCVSFAVRSESSNTVQNNQSLNG